MQEQASSSGSSSEATSSGLETVKDELKRKQEEFDRLQAEMESMRYKMAKIEEQKDMDKIQDKKLLKFAKVAQANLIDSANSMTINEILVSDVKREKGKSRTIRSLLIDYHTRAGPSTRISEMKPEKSAAAAAATDAAEPVVVEEPATQTLEAVELPTTSAVAAAAAASVEPVVKPVAVVTAAQIAKPIQIIEARLVAPSTSGVKTALSSRNDYTRENELSQRMMEETQAAAAEARKTAERKRGPSSTVVVESVYRLSFNRKS